MRILWFNWRCIKHPLAGGAEVYTHEIAKRLVKEGHEVILVTSRPKSLPKEEIINGYKVIRSGGKYTVYVKARKIYKKLKKVGWMPDIVIDEVNTIPFFTVYYVKEPIVMLIHQLCKECWKYSYKFPISWMGWSIEKWVHKIYRRATDAGKIKSIITVSPSTKSNLIDLGYPENVISIVYNGVDIGNHIDCEKLLREKENIVLYLGRISPYKRIEHILYAWRYVKMNHKDAKLIIAGRADEKYFRKLSSLSRNLGLKDVEFRLNLSEDEKIKLYKISKVNVIASVREGWGLTVIEAGRYCTPTIAYKAPGIQDSIRHGETGLLVDQQEPEALAHSILVVLKNDVIWRKIALKCREYYINNSWDTTYLHFKKSILDL